jgi:hypothetical protein
MLPCKFVERWGKVQSMELRACLVDRPNSEYPISAEILLFVSPVCPSRHCRIRTKTAPHPCPVAKPESSFASELGPTRPETGGPHAPQTPPRPFLPLLSHLTLSPRAPSLSRPHLLLPSTTPAVAPPQKLPATAPEAGAPAAAEAGAHRRCRG